MTRKLYEIGEYFSDLDQNLDKLPLLLKAIWVATTLFMAMLAFGFITFAIPGLFTDSETVMLIASIPGAVAGLSTVITSYIVVGEFVNTIHEFKK